MSPMNLFNSGRVLTKWFIFVVFPFVVKIACLVCFIIIIFIVAVGGVVFYYIRTVQTVFNSSKKSGLCSSHYKFKIKRKVLFIYQSNFRIFRWMTFSCEFPTLFFEYFIMSNMLYESTGLDKFSS